jgi:hypothetical protein
LLTFLTENLRDVTLSDKRLIRYLTPALDKISIKSGNVESYTKPIYLIPSQLQLHAFLFFRLLKESSVSTWVDKSMLHHQFSKYLVGMSLLFTVA